MYSCTKNYQESNEEWKKRRHDHTTSLLEKFQMLVIMLEVTSNCLINILVLAQDASVCILVYAL